MNEYVNEVEVTDLNPIVEVGPVEPHFQIEWTIGKRCNYDCSYCPPIWHDKTSKDLTFDELKSAWLKIIDVTAHKPEQKIYLSILGGEPSLNKNLLPFLKWVRENYSSKVGEIGTVSNGSASSKFYIELTKYCNWVTFSTHSEFINEKKFFRNVLRAAKHSKITNCMIMVNLMQEHWNVDRVNQYKEFLNKFQIKNYAHPVYYGEGFNEFGGKRIDIKPVRDSNKVKFK